MAAAKQKKKPAKAKAVKAPAKKRKRQPPRKIPLILQERIVEETDDQGRTGRAKITVGELIVRAVRIGAYKAQAAEAAGVHETTLYKWIERGEDALALAAEKAEETEEVGVGDVPTTEKPYVEFVESLKKAEASAEVWHLGNIRRHATKNWTASAWYLERTKRDRYGRFNEQGSTVPTLVDLQAAVDAAKKT